MRSVESFSFNHKLWPERLVHRGGMTTALQCVLVLLLVGGHVHGMTEKQVKSAGKLLRNNCQPKVKATDAMIDDMHTGKWDEDPVAKCYMHCILTMAKLIKKSGEFDYESAEKQIGALPEPRIAPTRESIEKCKDQTGTDKCDSAWHIAKCMYFSNPANYFLP